MLLQVSLLLLLVLLLLLRLLSQGRGVELLSRWVWSVPPSAAWPYLQLHVLLQRQILQLLVMLLLLVPRHAKKDNPGGPQQQWGDVCCSWEGERAKGVSSPLVLLFLLLLLLLLLLLPQLLQPLALRVVPPSAAIRRADGAPWLTTNPSLLSC